MDPRFGIHQSRGPWEEIHCGRRGLGSHADGRCRGARPERLKIVAATLTGMTTEQFQADVKNWLTTAKDHRWKRPYTELTYQLMQEVLKYLRANGYKTYIVTGGGQDFVRVYSEEVYGIPPEQVVGSAGAVKYGYDKDGKPILTKEPKLLLNDNDAGKPEGIHLEIGRRPFAAFGNSTGDRQMLEFTKAAIIDARSARRRRARVCLRPGPRAAKNEGGHVQSGALRRGEEGWLVGHQHEERLEAYFCFRELTRIMCTRESKILLGRAAGL